jgi:beta-xylosidase
MKTYTNPVWEADFPDPHVLAFQGRYYAYATETFARGSGFQVMESTDLVHWTHRGICFTPPWSKEHLWAPEVAVRGGVLSMTYSARNQTTGKHDIGIATAKNPLGPFEHKAILVSGENNKVGVIDTTVHIEKDGSAYLLYSEEEPRRIVAKKLAADWLSVTGEPVELVRPTLPWERGVAEAPTVLVRGGKYHLLYSGGWFESKKNDASYCVAHAVSDRLLGPYTKTGALLASLPGRVWGPGHQCVVTVGKTDWLLYHGWSDENEPRYGSNPKGRTLRMEKLTWRGGVLQPMAPTLSPQPAPK